MALSRDHYVVFDDTSSHQHLQAIVTIYCQPNFFNVTERKLSILLNSVSTNRVWEIKPVKGLYLQLAQ